MTEDQKDAIRADAKTMTAVEVARKHTITRQRVYQVLAQAPDEGKRAKERELGIVYEETEPDAADQPVVDGVVLFHNVKLRHLEDAALQAKIRAEPPNYLAIAQKYGITWNSVQRIRRGQRVATAEGQHGRRQGFIGMSCKPEEVVSIKGRAKARGMTVSAFVLQCIRQAHQLDASSLSQR